MAQLHSTNPVVVFLLAVHPVASVARRLHFRRCLPPRTPRKKQPARSRLSQPPLPSLWLYAFALPSLAAPPWLVNPACPSPPAVYARATPLPPVTLPLRSLSHSPHPRLDETLSPLLAPFGVRLGSSSVFINRRFGSSSGGGELKLPGFKRHRLSYVFVRAHAPPHTHPFELAVSALPPLVSPQDRRRFSPDVVPLRARFVSASEFEKKTGNALVLFLYLGCARGRG
ncbi:hypothetical protein NL676_030289 [Syzygium grande]|nr:hypothetical protein NL676_030289 [Syzygium grande]